MGSDVTLHGDMRLVI